MSEADVPACANGADDDGDGLADYPLDPGCTDAFDTDETNVIAAGTGGAGGQAGAGGQGGTSGAGGQGQGGSGGSQGQGGVPDLGGVLAPTGDAGGEGSCGCRIIGDTGEGRAALALGIFAVGLAARRRRR